MFEDIEQLEQQVAEFQKNILASTTLINTLKELIHAIKEETAKVVANMDKNAVTVSVDIAKTNAEMIDNAEAKIFKISDDALTNYRKINNDYIEKLENTSSNLIKMQDQLELRFTQFTERLEDTSIDKLFEQFQKIEKSVITKINILLLGIGLTAVLTLLSFILR